MNVGVICPHDYHSTENKLTCNGTIVFGNEKKTYKFPVASSTGVCYVETNVLEALDSQVYEKCIKDALRPSFEDWLKARVAVLDIFDGASHQLVNDSNEETISTYLKNHFKLVTALLECSTKSGADDLFTGKPSICEIVLSADSVMTRSSDNQSFEILYLPFSPVVLSANYKRHINEVAMKAMGKDAKGAMNLESGVVTALTQTVIDVDYNSSANLRQVYNGKLYLLSNDDRKNSMRAVAENNCNSRVEISAIRLVEKTLSSVKKLIKSNPDDCEIYISFAGNVYPDDFYDYLHYVTRALKRDNVACRLVFKIYSTQYIDSPIDEQSKVRAFIDKHKSFLTLEAVPSIDLTMNSNMNSLFITENPDRMKLVFILDVLALYQSGTAPAELEDIGAHVSAFKAFNDTFCSPDNTGFQGKSLNYYKSAVTKLSAAIGKRTIERNIYSKSLNLELYKKIDKCVETNKNKCVVFLYISKLEVLSNEQIKYSSLCKHELYEGTVVWVMEKEQLPKSAGMKSLCELMAEVEQIHKSHDIAVVDESSVTVSLWQIIKLISSKLYKKIDISEIENGDAADKSMFLDVAQNILVNINYSATPAFTLAYNANSPKGNDCGAHIEKIQEIAGELIRHIADVLVEYANGNCLVHRYYTYAISIAISGRAMCVEDLLFAYMLKCRQNHLKFLRPESKEINVTWAEDGTGKQKWISDSYKEAYDLIDDRVYYNDMIEAMDKGSFSAMDDFRFRELLENQPGYNSSADIDIRRTQDWALLKKACENLDFRETRLYRNIEINYKI